jgi:hypothetical protein
MLKILSVVLTLSMCAVVPPLFGADDLKQPQVTKAERFDFAPGGTVRINDSYGSLGVEGWDQPEVEITMTKSLHFGESKIQDHDQLSLESVQVTADRNSPTELTISTKLASRHGDWVPFRSPTTAGGLMEEVEIHVPRDTRLAIHHHTGYVFVSGVTSDIEASVSRGDIMLMLPDSGSYSIDAKTKLGKVASDFEGSALSRYLVGQRFTRTLTPPSQQLYLRMGFGGITIKAVPPEAEASVSAGGK